MRHRRTALAALVIAFCIAGASAQTGGARKVDAVLQSGHDSIVRAVAIDRTGKFVLSGGLGGARLWDIDTGRELRAWHHRGTANAFSPDGSLIGIASPGRIQVHRTDTGVLVHTVEIKGTAQKLQNLVFCPSNRCLAAACREAVRLWTLEPGGAMTEVPLEQRPGDVVAMSPDGGRLAAATRANNGDYGVTAWDLRSRQIILRDVGKMRSAVAIGFASNDLLQVVGEQNCAMKKRPCTPVEVRSWNLSAPEPPSSVAVESASAMAFALSAGRIAIGGGSSFRVADAVSGKMLMEVPFEPGVRSIAFSPDATLLATGTSDGRIALWRTGAREPLRVFEGVMDEMEDASFAEGGRLLSAVGSSHADGYGSRLHRWDLRTGEASLLLHSSVLEVLSPDGEWLVSREKQILVARHRFNGKRIELPSSAWEEAMFSPDSRYFAAADRDPLKIWTVPDWKVKAAPPCFGPFSFDESGKRLAVAGCSKAIRVIELESGAEREFPRAAGDLPYWAIAFFPTGTRFAVVGNRIIEVFDAATGAKEYELPASRGTVRTLAFRPDGQMLASGDSTGEIRLWDLATRKFVAFEAHGWIVDAVTFSPDGRFLVSASHDGTLSVWDPDSRTRLLRFMTLRESDDWLAMTDEGLFDGTAEAMRRIYWRIGDGNVVVPLDTFFNEFFYPGLVADIFMGRRPRPKNDLISLLQVPGLRTMILKDLAKIDRRKDGLLSVCFKSEVTAHPDIYSDGVPLALDPGSLLHNADNPECPYEFILPRNTQIEMGGAAIPIEAQEERVGEPKYDGQSSAVEGSTLHVFITGISNYELKTSGFRPLPNGFVASLRRLEDAFRKSSTPGDLAGYQQLRVWGGLYDADATRKRLRERFAEMANAIRPNDVVLLYFGGHGVVPAGQEMFCFATADIRGPEPALQMETGFTTALFAEVIRRIPARRIVLLIDACQSGGAIESLARVAETKALVAERSAETNGPESRVGVYVIAAATPLQEALQSPDGESLLFRAFESAVRDHAAPLTVRALVERIRSGYSGATPLVEAFGVDFPLVTISASVQ